MLIDSVEDKKDFWLIYELCPGKTMNELLFDVKGEFYKGERIYMVHHSSFYFALRANILLLKEFLLRMIDALNLFAKLSIVHADLKPDNIFFSNGVVKLGDFGFCKSLEKANMTKTMLGSPIYMAPEILRG